MACQGRQCRFGWRGQAEAHLQGRHFHSDVVAGEDVVQDVMLVQHCPRERAGNVSDSRPRVLGFLQVPGAQLELEQDKEREGT